MTRRTIDGVHGPIAVAELGQTLVHEHITTADWSMRVAFGDRYYEHAVVADRAVRQFTRAGEVGVRTVVDATPVNMGRDVALIAEVAERTGLNFIVSAGFYYQDEVYLNWRTVEEVHELVDGECRDGIGTTGVRPGILKTACADAGLTPILQTVFRAVGRAAAEHDLPVFCHHHPHVGNGGEIVDLLAAEGVAPHQIVLGHSGDSDDLDYLRAMLDRGCYLGMDRFGYCDVGLDLQQRVAVIAELVRRGYGDRLLLSHDLATYFAVFGRWADFKADDTDPEVDFTFVHTRVLPALERAGVDPVQARAMIEANPAALLSCAAVA